MPERKWPMMVTPDEGNHELSLAGWLTPVVAETAEDIHARLGQKAAKKEGRDAVTLVHMPR